VWRAAALREQASYTAFLLDLLDAECEHRDERRKNRLVREAHFPRAKRLEAFDFTANPNITPEVVNTLGSAGWKFHAPAHGWDTQLWSRLGKPR
jgi:DNA replication protein DnaC